MCSIDFDDDNDDNDDDDDDDDDSCVDFSVLLTGVRRDDAGFYQCVVNSSVAMDAVVTATAYLHVTSSRDSDVRQRARGRHRGGMMTSDL